MTTRTTAEDRLPGDPTPRQYVERAIRVDHAGEYGAKRIYQGQLAVLGRSKYGPMIEHMKAQEQVHLDTFSRLIAQRRVRPTALLPIWHVAGFALGAATALLGHRGAMACTVAVEEAIDEHYRAQEDALGEDEAELQGAYREVPRRGARAPRHRPGERGRAGAGLPAAERRDQGRLQGGDPHQRARLTRAVERGGRRDLHVESRAGTVVSELA